MKTAWMLAAVCSLLPLAAGPSASGTNPSAEDVTLTCPETGYPLDDLVTMASDLTGEPFLYDPKDLREQRAWFTGKLVVPRERFLVVFDRLLRDQEFVHLESVELGRTIHTLRRLGQQARGQQLLKSQARVLSVDELMAYSERQVLVTTSLSLQNVPAREAVTTLQIYFSDSSTESIRNIEGTDVILMTGFSNNLAAVVRMIRRVDLEATTQHGGREMRSFEERLAKVEKQLAVLLPAEKPADAPARK